MQQNLLHSWGLDIWLTSGAFNAPEVGVGCDYRLINPLNVKLVSLAVTAANATLCTDVAVTVCDGVYPSSLQYIHTIYITVSRLLLASLLLFPSNPCEAVTILSLNFELLARFFLCQLSGPIDTHFCSFTFNFNHWDPYHEGYKFKNITRWAGQSPTWGHPSPQFRVQNQFKLSKFLSWQWQ